MFITPRELPSIPPALPVHRTIRPTWTDQEAAQFAKRLGVDAPAKEFEPWWVFRKDGACVEIYRATHSVRVTRAAFDREGTATGPEQIPPDGAAVERANQFVEGLRDIHRSEPLSPKLSRLEPKLSRLEAMTQAPGGPRGSIRTVAVQINYRFALDGLPLLGPGAKAQVTIGRSGDMEQAYLFWRQSAPTNEQWTTRSAAAALAALAESPFLAPVIRTGDVEVLRIQLGWLSLPPTIVQDTFFPVYEIRGRFVAEIDAGRERDFVVYIAAAARTPQPDGNTAAPWPALVIA
jgi:hypothetical protein